MNLKSLVLSDIEELKGNIGVYLPLSLLELSVENCINFKDLSGLSKQSQLTRLKVVLCPNLSDKFAASFPFSLKEFETIQSSFENFKGIHPSVSLERFIFNRYYSSKKPINLLEGLSRSQLHRLDFDWVPPTYRSSLQALRNRAYHRLNQKAMKKVKYSHFLVKHLVRNVRKFLTR